ncbi:MAG: dTDP-4-dehydrorhamnose 3,5-epimerase family protein [Anaerolineae bacterium]|nr:dTDP-4-dehydrorhamnose 3,5-epimerase family protein [Anaerolineae bacterium]
MTMHDQTTQLLGPIRRSELIEGVFFAPIKAYEDERGRFMETFRREWFPWVNWDRIQGNRSDSKAGVLRGLHYHHHQIDYWYVPDGKIRVGMVDLRPSSRTFMVTQTLEIGSENNLGVFIPVGVAHGFLALTDATLMYMVNNYYNGGADENGVAWNDPEIALNWGTQAPLLSPRDQKNRFWRDIPEGERPR